MSDDEADPELLELLRQHLQGRPAVSQEPETGVLEGAEELCDDSIDVMLDMRATKNAAATIYEQMQQAGFSTASWGDHEMHPEARDETTVAFIFTMDLLNFSFWSELPEDERYAVSYRDKRWTGYGSLVASLQRALEEGGFLVSSLLSVPFQGVPSLINSLRAKQIFPSPTRTTGRTRRSAIWNH